MIEQRGYDIRWIRKDAPGVSDIEVMQLAYRDNRVILTFDHDFGELAVKDTAYPSVGIILLRLHQMTPGDMAEYITNIICSRDDWEGYFSVLEYDRIRMRSLH
ncbi:hypothetical protein FTO68_04685 [Methanocalculus taiwanensis]|uniref:DUF5615 domain-containing protein n=1 Tax=Methanocalculus taiwanensis TaxID=106207 RepID=A0ABD4TKE5_9EURY|nr:DUF5615 family PIN-like protein [Methanocalculus taiwanensis]MCQ1538285.1 hypothetical protein [Methanocalculus taiwanensis]